LRRHSGLYRVNNGKKSKEKKNTRLSETEGCAKDIAMVYLDWKKQGIALEVKSLGRLGSKLSLTIREGDLADFLPALEEIYIRDEGELRLELPENWVIYWKAKESGNRVLVAHPQPDHWVATVALEREVGQKLILAVKALKSSESFILSQIAPLEAVSNLNIEVVRR
jgi:hypothetical protein